MNEVLLVLGLSVFLLVIISVVYVWYSQSLSISYLKQRGRVIEIIKIFESENTETNRRLEALHALIELGTPEAFTSLSNGLGSMRGNIRNQLIKELPRLGKTFYPYLAEAFRKNRGQAAVVRVMEAMGPESGDALTPFLSQPEPALRTATLKALNQVGWRPEKNATGAAYWIAQRLPKQCVDIGSPAVPVLIDATRDASLCPEIIETLGEIRDPEGGWALLSLSKNPQYSMQVIQALARWKEPGVPFLAAALKNPDREIKQTAAHVLELMNWVPGRDEAGAIYWVFKRRWDRCAEMGEPALLPLMEALKDDDSQVRKAAVQTLGNLGVEKAVDGLLLALRDPVLDVKMAAVEGLGKYPGSNTAEALVKTLEDEVLYPKAINALTEMGNASLSHLLVALRAPEGTVRGRAAEALERIGWTPANDPAGAAYWIARQDWQKCAALGEAATELLVEELNNPRTCVDAARALAKIGDQRAIAPLINSFAGKPAVLQQSISEALGWMGTPAVEPLLEALRMGKIDIQPVIQALGWIGDERAARPLTTFLTNRYPLSVREAAAHALARIGFSALEPMFEALRGEDMDPRAAGMALGEVGKPGRDRLIEALHSHDFDAQILVYALGKIHDELAADAILETLEEGQYGQEIRKTAIEALQEIGIPAIQPLINSLGMRHKNIASVSAALVSIGEPAVEPLIRALKSCYLPGQCEAIVQILGEIGDLRAVNPLVDALKTRNISKVIINTALDSIWKSHRREHGAY